jgi:hypothetical protein
VHTGWRRWAALTFGVLVVVTLVAVLATSDTPLPGIGVVAALAVAVGRRTSGVHRPGGSPPRAAPRPSDAFDRFEPARPDRVGERLVVALVLVGVAQMP